MSVYVGLSWSSFSALLGFITSAIGSAFSFLDSFILFTTLGSISVSILDLLVGFSALYLFVDFLSSLDVVGGDGKANQR